MQAITTVNSRQAGKVWSSQIDGRQYLVAPVTMIREGVLPGNRGPILYTNSAVNQNVQRWNMMPIVLGHPEDKHGNKISARDPDVINKLGLGFVFNTHYLGNRLRAETWFDAEKTRKAAPAVYRSLIQNEPIELSTGLFTKTVNRDGTFEGRRYHSALQEYLPDHLAILLDEVGACSRTDGCGVLVNQRSDMKALVSEYQRTDTRKTFSQWITSNKKDCGCGGKKKKCSCPNKKTTKPSIGSFQKK